MKGTGRAFSYIGTEIASSPPPGYSAPSSQRQKKNMSF
jgi:hypothetical protein